MPTRIQIRRDTAANFAAADPLLLAGEPAYETDTRKWKIGDGESRWSTLPYSIDLPFGSTDKSKIDSIEPGAQPNPARVTTGERATCASTDVRLFSPEDIRTIAASQGPARGVSHVPFYGRVGRLESPWNQRLGPYTSYRDSPINLATQRLSPASRDRSWGNVPIVYAQASDPVIRIFYNPNIHSRFQAPAPVWLKHSNPAAVEDAIVNDPQANERFVATNGKRVYMPTYATAKSGRVWHNGGNPDPQKCWFRQLHRPANGWPIRVHCPAGRLPMMDNHDSWLVLVQPSGLIVETFATVQLNTKYGGDIACQFVAFSHMDSLGDYTDNGIRASMLPTFFGAIRKNEILTEWNAANVTGGIDHAVACAVGANLLRESFVYPAGSFDTNSGYSGQLPMGTRLAIPWSTDIETLTWRTEAGRMMARACHRYGLIIADRGAPNSITPHTEMAICDGNPAIEGYDPAWKTWSSAWAADELQLLSLLKVVDCVESGVRQLVGGTLTVGFCDHGKTILARGATPVTVNFRDAVDAGLSTLPTGCWVTVAQRETSATVAITLPAGATWLNPPAFDATSLKTFKIVCLSHTLFDAMRIA